MRRDARDNRDTIIATGRRMFSEGNADASMRAIAREAGLGVATVSRHFPTREELVVAVIDDAVHDIEEVVEEHRGAMERAPKESWHDAVLAVADLRLAALAQGIVGLFHLDHMTVKFPPEDLKPYVEIVLGMQERLTNAYNLILEPAKEAGLVEKGLHPLRFHLGLAATSRPVPDLMNTYLPDATHWLVKTYLDGLAHQAHSDAKEHAAPGKDTAFKLFEEEASE